VSWIKVCVYRIKKWPALANLHFRFVAQSQGSIRCRKFACYSVSRETKLPTQRYEREIRRIVSSPVIYESHRYEMHNVNDAYKYIIAAFHCAADADLVPITKGSLTSSCDAGCDGSLRCCGLQDQLCRCVPRVYSHTRAARASRVALHFGDERGT